MQNGVQWYGHVLRSKDTDHTMRSSSFNVENYMESMYIMSARNWGNKYKICKCISGYVHIRGFWDNNCEIIETQHAPSVG